MRSDITPIGASPTPVKPIALPEPIQTKPRPEPVVRAVLPTAIAASIPPEQADPQRMRQELTEAVDKLNQQMTRNNYNLAFTMDDSTNQVVIQVRNKNTGDLVRQIPNEAALRMANHFEDLRGFLQDERI
jgi:flagellar protein FlaG